MRSRLENGDWAEPLDPRGMGHSKKWHKRVRQLLETMYDNQPDGLAGNEDCGQMSAWYVMSALSFYAVGPASGNYVFGAPLFVRASVQLGNGKTLDIKAERSSPTINIFNRSNSMASLIQKCGSVTQTL